MPDVPDYSKYLPGSARFSLQDMGELAARLGSVDVYDRRGEVIWWDDGSHGIGSWIRTGAGLNNAIHIVTQPAFMSGFSVQMIAGSDGLLNAQIARYISPSTPAKMGIETSICFTTEFDHLDMYISIAISGTRYSGYLRVNRITNQLEIYDASAGFVNIGPAPSTVNPYDIFENIKLVVDFVTNKYVRLLYNQYEYNISAYTLPSVATPDPDNHRALISLFGIGGINSLAYVGQVIITSNEP